MVKFFQKEKKTSKTTKNLKKIQKRKVILKKKKNFRCSKIFKQRKIN